MENFKKGLKKIAPLMIGALSLLNVAKGQTDSNKYNEFGKAGDTQKPNPVVVKIKGVRQAGSLILQVGKGENALLVEYDQEGRVVGGQMGILEYSEKDTSFTPDHVAKTDVKKARKSYSHADSTGHGSVTIFPGNFDFEDDTLKVFGEDGQPVKSYKNVPTDTEMGVNVELGDVLYKNQLYVTGGIGGEYIPAMFTNGGEFFGKNPQYKDYLYSISVGARKDFKKSFISAEMKYVGGRYTTATLPYYEESSNMIDAASINLSAGKNLGSVKRGTFVPKFGISGGVSAGVFPNALGEQKFTYGVSAGVAAFLPKGYFLGVDASVMKQPHPWEDGKGAEAYGIKAKLGVPLNFEKSAKNK